MIDSHCHLDYLKKPVEEALKNAREAGVTDVVTIGTDMKSSEEALRIASENDGVWAAVGIHPHDASAFDEAAAAGLARFAEDPKVVGIGETGFDFYRDLSPRDVQAEAFRSQVELAKSLDKALVVHMRDSHDEVFELLREVGPPPRLVFHCFSGGPAEAKTALGLGGYLSFAGNVSFPSASDLRKAAEVCPQEQLLVETDSPFLTPVPYRGGPNEPAFVVKVVDAVAKSVGRSAEDVARSTAANARRVFRLP